MAIYLVAIDKRGVAYATPWLLHHKIQPPEWPPPIGRIVERDDAYFGGVWQTGTRYRPKSRRGGIHRNPKGHPVEGFLEKMSDLSNEPMSQVLQQQVEPASTWRKNGVGG